MRRVFVLPVLIVLIGCAETSQVKVQGAREVTFTAEVADNMVEQTLGLMFRKSLAPDRGMLFVYDEPGGRSFWMKNTRIPLDIIFIDAEGQVTNIEEAQPCRSNPCKRYNSRGRVKYVLEINQGLSREYGFTKGSQVELNLDQAFLQQ